MNLLSPMRLVQIKKNLAQIRAPPFCRGLVRYRRRQFGGVAVTEVSRCRRGLMMVSNDGSSV